MTEKDEPNNIFDDTVFSDDQPSKNNPVEGSNETSDNDEEIIELTDPEDTPATESEEEVIEPADFLDELSEDETSFAGQTTRTIPPSDDDDIIELTDSAEMPAKGASSTREASPSGGQPPSDDKDLFIFTDSQDEAVIQDDDILSDTVFANELAPEGGQTADADLKIPPQETEDAPAQDGTIFDDTVFAKEPSEDDDQELAVLTEIDEKSPQIENGMLSDTVFSSDSLDDGDEELAVLTESDKGIEPLADETPADIDSDMVLLDDTQSETAIEQEDGFIQLDSETPPESVPLEIESANGSDIADSLGMDLETNASPSQDTKEIDDEAELTIEPDLNNLEPDATPFDAETPLDISVDATQMDQSLQSASSEPIQIHPDQLEAAVEKAVIKLFAGKIDGMIIDVIEKVVKRDIEKIKKELLKGTTDNL